MTFLPHLSRVDFVDVSVQRAPFFQHFSVDVIRKSYLVIAHNRLYEKNVVTDENGAIKTMIPNVALDPGERMAQYIAGHIFQVRISTYKL